MIFRKMPARWALPSYYLKTKKGKVTFLVLRYHAQTFGFPCFPHTASFRDFRPETNSVLPFPAHPPDPGPFPASGFTAIPEYEAGLLLQEQRTLFQKSVFETMLQSLTVNSDQLQKPAWTFEAASAVPGISLRMENRKPCTCRNGRKTSFPLTAREIFYPHSIFSARFSGIGIGQPIPACYCSGCRPYPAGSELLLIEETGTLFSGWI